MQMRTARVSGGAADAEHFPMRHGRTAQYRTGLHRDRTHVPIVCVVTVGMMQADVNAQVHLMVLRVPPTGINDLVCVRRGIHRAVRDAVSHAIMPIVIYPVSKAMGPGSTRARRAGSGLWWT